MSCQERRKSLSSWYGATKNLKSLLLLEIRVCFPINEAFAIFPQATRAQFPQAAALDFATVVVYHGPGGERRRGRDTAGGGGGAQVIKRAN